MSNFLMNHGLSACMGDALCWSREKDQARRIPLRDVKVGLKGGQASPAQLGKTARLKGSL